MATTPIRVAIAGVGNCATSLIQGVEYYRDAKATDTVPGLMHVQFGDYHVSDLEFVAAFDVDAKKVGLDLSEAILASDARLREVVSAELQAVADEHGDDRRTVLLEAETAAGVLARIRDRLIEKGVSC